MAEGTGKASRERRAGCRGRQGVCAAESVAVVLDEPEIVFFYEIYDGIKMEGNAHRVSHHDGLRLRTDGIGKSFGDSGIVAKIHIDENGD